MLPSPASWRRAFLPSYALVSLSKTTTSMRSIVISCFLSLNYCPRRPSFKLTNPRLFGNNPLPHILRTMPKLDSLRFTNCEEVHRIEIHESYVLKVQHEPACSSVNLCLQVLYSFRFNSPAEPENRVRPIRHSLDLQNHLPDLTGKNCNCWATLKLMTRAGFAGFFRGKFRQLATSTNPASAPAPQAPTVTPPST